MDKEEVGGVDEVQDKEEVEGVDMKTVDEGAEGSLNWVNSQGEGHKGCLYLKMPQVFR